MGHLEGEASAPLCERGRGAYYETGARTRRMYAAAVAVVVVAAVAAGSRFHCPSLKCNRECSLCSGAQLDSNEPIAFAIDRG